MILKCLSFKFEDRPKINEILQHDFFSDCNSEEYIIYPTESSKENDIEKEIVKTLNKVIELDENEDDNHIEIDKE